MTEEHKLFDTLTAKLIDDIEKLNNKIDRLLDKLENQGNKISELVQDIEILKIKNYQEHQKYEDMNMSIMNKISELSDKQRTHEDLHKNAHKKTLATGKEIMDFLIKLGATAVVLSGIGYIIMRIMQSLITNGIIK